MNKRIQTKEQRQKQVILRLKNENARLRERVAVLEKENEFLKEKLETALLHIEELQKYVFRGKKNDNDEDNKKDNDKKNNSGGKKDRKASSYRRAVPEESDITDEETHDIKCCPDCNTVLTRLKLLEFYEEDIVPMKDWFDSLKKIKRIKIRTGYCPHCKKRYSAIPIPKQRVFLGENIRKLIVFQYTVQQLSHSQVLDFSEGVLRMKISKGEIVHILDNQANSLGQAYNDLLQNIRGRAGVHIDESSWNVARNNRYGGNYVWAMTGIDNTDVIYRFGQNRGIGNVKELLGDGFSGIGVTDDYGAYKNSFKKDKHALCWAHPMRKLRDLKNTKQLTARRKENCKIAYAEFSGIYREVEKVLSSPFEKQERVRKRKLLMQKLEKIIMVKKDDPLKLKKIKTRLAQQINCYFVCITNPNIPTSNNKAERALRHLVIKRKKSFGSKTSKGAKTISVLYSVIMSLWWRSKSNFFNAYDDALA